MARSGSAREAAALRARSSIRRNPGRPGESSGFNAGHRRSPKAGPWLTITCAAFLRTPRAGYGSVPMVVASTSSTRITSYNVCYTKLLRTSCAMRIRARRIATSSITTRPPLGGWELSWGSTCWEVMTALSPPHGTELKEPECGQKDTAQTPPVKCSRGRNNFV